MSKSPTTELPEDHQDLAAFLIEKIGKLWVGQESSGHYHTHPDFENVASKLLTLLASEFGPEEVTASTAKLLCYQHRPQELEWSKVCHTWKIREKRQRISFGACLWQATYPSNFARDLFLEEFEWETQTPFPNPLWVDIGLASGVLDSWLGKPGRWLGSDVPPIRSTPDERALEMIEVILRRGLFGWSKHTKLSVYASFFFALKDSGRLEMDLFRQVLNLEPGIATYDYKRILERELMDAFYEFAAELNEENSRRFCHLRQPSGARWVIRACENVERLGLTTLASRPADAYDLRYAIRKIARIDDFSQGDEIASFKAELNRFSSNTRRLVAASSPVARPQLLDDPASALPEVFDRFKERFLSFNPSFSIYFDNSADPTNGVLPVSELRELATELGETGRRWMIEEFAQLGGEAQHAVLLLNGLFGIDRKKIEASITRSNQTAVKAYGLFELPAAEPARSKELLARYARIKQYAKDAGSFKAGRRTNSLAAAQAGLANLAQSAGFASATAMEIEIMLSSGGASEMPSTISFESSMVSVNLTPSGPKLVVSKGGKPQKSVPAALKKLPAFVDLEEKRAAMADQFLHFSSLFEGKMVGESPIPEAEFSKLMQLPISKWIVQRLLLRNGDFIGLLDDAGTCLDNMKETRPISGEVFIVHPVLLPEEQISAWRSRLESRGLESVFPQLAREIYLLDENEIGVSGCKRFAGRSVDCTKAVRALTGLGWTASKVDYPFFYKTYQTQGLRVSLLPGDSIASFEGGEDFLIDDFCFSSSAREYFDHYSPIPLRDVQQVVFSEVVRDLTLFIDGR